jgi:hypothetical protein
MRWSIAPTAEFFGVWIPLRASRFPADEGIYSPNPFLAGRFQPHGTAWTLPGMTERSFGALVSGGSEDGRRTVVNACRVYLHYSTNQSKAGPKPSEPLLRKGDRPWI